MMRKRGFAGLFSLGLLLIVAVLVWVGPLDVVASIALLDAWWFSVFLGIQLVMMVLWALKWWVVLSPYRVPFHKVLPTSFVGYLLNCLTPANMAGGEPVRAYVLSRIDDIPAEKSAASVVVDLFLEVTVIFLYVVLALAVSFSYDLPPTLYAVMGVALAFMLGVFFLFTYIPFNDTFSRTMLHRIFSLCCRVPFLSSRAEQATHRVDGIVDEFQQALKTTFARPHLLGTGLLISIVIWSISIARTYLIFVMLGVPVAPIVLVIVRIVVAALSLFSVIPGATGVFEGASTGLYHLFGIDARTALAATLIDRLFSFWLGMGIGLAASAYLGTTHLVTCYVKEDTDTCSFKES